MNYLSKGVGYFDKWFWVKSRVKSDHEYDIARPQFAADDEIQQIDKKQRIRVLVLLWLSL